ncbi:5-formyltetrahydrofolate cyclo-ligase [Riemerella columbipharyngis]|uniref:5-formyltetrahydrofolate cyclo-ligase n=1 Tax=Riemerella columbipharyngis TaxID=1071918 RepID=A0A1G7DX78_9FLAO|nr:5-formyltetrahydrofolate cyclo-ligase [Riemerella columbipharyngis]SDE56058.1 5-formyltetrahydrofolate cyclo-ligase [Riemerella columbipharyngis]
MNKAALRKKYLEKRKSLSQNQIDCLSKKILENFILQFNPIENQKVHIFLPIKKFNEVNTLFFIDYFFSKKIQVYVPKMVEDNLIAIKLNQNTILEKNSWGILEPLGDEDSKISDYDFVITPLLYCDRRGNRVGYGKGFYDNFFAQIASSCKRVGVGFFSPDENITDLYCTDVSLNFLVLPDEVLSFEF